MIKIIIADDQLLFRSMLEEILIKDGEIEVIASCSNGKDLIENCRKLNPDLVLLDIGMPGHDGISVLKELKDNYPSIKVVMLTAFENDENIRSAVFHGADGYLLKDMVPQVLIMSVKCIYNGMILFHRSAYKLLQNSILSSRISKNQKVTVGNLVFDPVDINIMQLIVQGKSNKEIGALLNYSEGTIKNKISRILSLTGFSDRTEISVFAINNAIV